MKVLIVGYGRMGREIEIICRERKHEISGRIDISAGDADFSNLSNDALKGSDIAIEFSLPEGVLQNARAYASAGLPAVVGTTGWEKDRDLVRSLIENSGSAYLWGSNFSLGAHLFFRLVNKAASMINSVPDYDILGYELHHHNKKDSPSGTALVMAEGILKHNKKKTSIITDKLNRAPKPEELHVASVRGGSIPGIHTVLLDSAADTIEIKHSARNRSGFALGAVMAAEWILGKKGFYSVEDFIQEILG